MTFISPSLNIALKLFSGFQKGLVFFCFYIRTFFVVKIQCFLQLFINQWVFALLEHFFLQINEKLLLGTVNWPRTNDPDPADEISGLHAIVFHDVESDERACSSKAGFAVHGYHAWCFFDMRKESIDDMLIGYWTVLKWIRKFLFLQNCWWNYI